MYALNVEEQDIQRTENQNAYFVDMVEKMSRITKKIKDNDYGWTDAKFEIAINIESIWDANPEEKAFINNYSKVVLHEWLHKEIADIVFNLFDPYEEFFVTTISGTDHLEYEKVEDKYLWQVLL